VLYTIEYVWYAGNMKCEFIKASFFQSYTAAGCLETKYYV